MNKILLAKMLRDLNLSIHSGKSQDVLNYHMNHIELVRKYMIEISKRLNVKLDNNTASVIAYGHDLLKERGIANEQENLLAPYESVSTDPARYVRTNLEILEKFGMDEYFNSDCQYHALASGIFLNKELGVEDANIVYPVMFHSCPVMDVYDTLPSYTKQLIDITLLSDKLSSNWLRINTQDKEVCIDLDLLVFGETGWEFNYLYGLYVARLIASKKNSGDHSKEATKYYFDRLKQTNPLIDEKVELGDKQTWPKRKQRFKMQ